MAVLTTPMWWIRMHAHAEIDGRYLALPVDAYYEMTTWGQANDAWIECAQDLGQQALCRALAGVGLAPRISTPCSWFRSRVLPVPRSTRAW